MWSSIAPHTQQTYSSSVRQYVELCTSLNIAAWPASQFQLSLFLAHMSGEHRGSGLQPLRALTLRVYLHAIGTFSEQLGYPNLVKGSVQLWRMWRGVQRTERQAVKRVRLPLTTQLLRRVTALSSTSSARQVMLIAACHLAVYGLLRSGELTRNSSRAACPLHWRDIQFVHDDGFVCSKQLFDSASRAKQLRVFLCTSKTDTQRHGITISIAAPSAISSLLRHAQAQGFPLVDSHPVFCEGRDSLRSLTRKELIEFTRSKLRLMPDWRSQAHQFSGHSFRKGGATSLHNAGVAEGMIRTMGRWQSDCARLYVQTNHNAIAAASRLM